MKTGRDQDCAGQGRHSERLRTLQDVAILYRLFLNALFGTRSELLDCWDRRPGFLAFSCLPVPPCLVLFNGVATPRHISCDSSYCGALNSATFKKKRSFSLRKETVFVLTWTWQRKYEPGDGSENTQFSPFCTSLKSPTRNRRPQISIV